jgi:hypothetical protein
MCQGTLWTHISGQYFYDDLNYAIQHKLGFKQTNMTHVFTTNDQNKKMKIQ